jgi:SAM-dependent methyltransferase
VAPIGNRPSRGIWVNVACGSSYITGGPWRNLDYGDDLPGVEATNLLEPLPLPDNGADVVYCSHFLEHVPRESVLELLREFHRVLSPGGTLRLVTPDLENIVVSLAETYATNNLARRKLLRLELLDQLVRRRPSGQLGAALNEIHTSDDLDMRDWVSDRLGPFATEDAPVTFQSRTWKGLPARGLMRARQAVARRVLPAAFWEQNVKPAGLGELHQWIWDFTELADELNSAGFADCRRVSHNLTSIPGFPLFPLDATATGASRKGSSSLFVEAVAG